MIPSKWDDVTIEGYVAFIKSLDENPVTNIDIVNLQIKRVCYLTGCEPEEAEQLSTKGLAAITKLIKTPLPQMGRKRFKLNGINYRFKLLSGPRTGGEYAAIMNAAKGGKLDNLHHIMFLISEPIKRHWLMFWKWKSYEFEATDIPQRIQDFKQLPLKIANPAAVFFSRLSKELTNLFQDYSLSQLKEITKGMQELEADLKKPMDGL
jgi:hypothetical protein